MEAEIYRGRDISGQRIYRGRDIMKVFSSMIHNHYRVETITITNRVNEP